MRMPCRFRFLEPTFFAGLLDDPLLWVHVRPAGRSLLFDCGQMTHLAKRVMKAIDAVFVTHAHMDHFMGIATLVRHLHASPRPIRIFGPPGIAARMAAILAGFDWNLTEPYWSTFMVTEIHPRSLVVHHLPGSAGFPAILQGEEEREGRIVYRDPFLRVEAEFADHKIPVLFYRITEHPDFAIDAVRLAAAGLATGEWLQELKRRCCGQKHPAGPLRAVGPDGKVVEINDPAALYRSICREEAPASIGYLTDIGFSSGNRERVVELLRGVTLLVCECSFLAHDEGKARKSWHLCTTDLNRLAAEIRPACLLPMHLSKSYLGKSDQLYQELSLPPGTELLRIPEHLVPRPLLAPEANDLLTVNRKE